MKYFIFICALLFTPLLSNAASGLSVHLYFGDNALSLRNPAVEKNPAQYFSVEEFDRQSAISSGNFILLITDWYGEELVQKRFDAQLGGFSLDVPYYPTLKQLEIKDSKSNTKIIDYDLSSISTCNVNKVCEFERGENGSSCIADCGTSNPNYSKETKSLLASNNGEIINESGKVLLKDNKSQTTFSWGALIAGVAIIGAIIVYVIIKRRRHV